MKKQALIATIFIMLALLLAINPFTPVMASPARIEEPSFETALPSTYWAYTEDSADYNGAQSPDWWTQGANSCLLSAVAGNIAGGKYGQFAQSVDFTYIDTFSFDVYLQTDVNGAYEARVIVGAATVWSQTVPTTATEYLHQEVDVSGYTGTLDLIFQLTTTATSKVATSNYFDNIKIWGSHDTSERTTVSNTFSNYGDIVYMYGENFNTDTHKVAYYDGGTLHDGADGTKIKTDTYSVNATGILDESQIRPADYPTASYGTWHAVSYNTTASMPASYDLVSTGNTSYVITDSFTVEEAAIPEFPTVFAAIAVVGLCSGVYYWMRRRYQRVEVRIK